MARINRFITGSTVVFIILSIGFGSVFVACSPTEDDLIPVVVQVGGRSMSKLPFIIAFDQGLYEKHGLRLELKLASPEFEGGKIPKAPIFTRILRRLKLVERPQTDISINGHTPSIWNLTHRASATRKIALASTDCAVRYYIVVRGGISELSQLKGKRIGINGLSTTSGFAGQRFVERMGWNRVQDVSIMTDARTIEALIEGRVDAMVGGDELYDAAKREGFKILEDTRHWKEQLSGNSVLVEPEWLSDASNYAVAERFLKAALEGLELFHNDPELALDVIRRWYGIQDLEIARGRYERADYVPEVPFPCYEGIRNTMALHDSNEMRKYKPEDFYDDTILRNLLENREP